jgi:hypothetical protein
VPGIGAGRWAGRTPRDGYDWQRNGTALAAGRSVVLGGTAWHVIDRASGDVRSLPPSPTEVSVAYPLGLIAGRLVTVAEQSGEEFGAPRFVVFRPDDPTAFGG